VRYINYLKNSGIDVFAVTNKINPSLDVKQYELKYGLPLFVSSQNSAFRNAISPLSILHVKNILRKEKPDIVHAHYTSSYGFIGALTNFKPLIISVWGSDVLLNQTKYFGILKRMSSFALKKASLIICDGVEVQKTVSSLGGKNIKLIYFGVDTDKFKPNKNKDNTLNIIISLRNHEPLYDVETFVKAIAIVNEKHLNSYFIVAGSGSQTEYLKKLSEHYPIEFPGNIDSNYYLNQSHIYVSTSKSDSGLSVSTGEAMACELPVVVTDFGDNNRWINDGVNGYLFPVGDYKILAEKIISLIDNKVMQKKMGEINRKIVEINFNEKIEMKKVIVLYKKLVMWGSIDESCPWCDHDNCDGDNCSVRWIKESRERNYRYDDE